jgi:hypothetical protein
LTGEEYQEMQKRIFFKLLLAAQFFVFAILFAVGLYLFAMSESSRTAPDAVAGMKSSSAICLLLTPFWLVPTVGIRRKAPWAWWAGFTVNLFAFLFLTWAFGFSMMQADFSAIIFPGVFLVITILHLLSRPTTWKAMDLPDYPSFAKRPI